MALEIYYINDKTRSKSLYVLEENVLDCMQIIIKEFKKSTGVSIDFNGDTRIYLTQLKLLLKIMSENNIEGEKQLNEFYSFLKRMIDQNANIILIGD